MNARDRRWCIAPDIAWVEGEERVALIRTGALAPKPMLVPEPVASLWRSLAERPTTVALLYGVGADLVDDDPAGFVDAALEALAAEELIRVAP